jgi:hypothetical protein
MSNPSPETQQQPHGAPRTHGRSLLLAADIATLVAVLLIHFLSAGAPRNTTVALIAVVVAGLFVFIPFLLDALRPVHAGGRNGTDAAALAGIQGAIRKDIRALYDGLTKHLTILEKAAAENAVVIEQIRAATQETAATAKAAVSAAQEAAAAATAAKDAAETEPATDNEEILEHLSVLNSLAGEDGEVKRLVVAFEAFQQEHRETLHTAVDIFRRLEEAVRQGAIANSPERDGPLPPSLAGKAFTATPSSAVSRLIGNAVRKAPATVAPEELRPTTPSEDELWNVATDMANAESESPAPSAPPAAAAPVVSASFSLSRPNQDNEEDIPLRWPESSLFPPSQSAPETQVNVSQENEVSQPKPISESARRILAATQLSVRTEPTPVPEPEPEEEPDPSPPPPAQTDLLSALGFQTPAPAPQVAQPAPRREHAHAPGVLIANVFTGLGGKPFVRGIGPGLSEDIGVPMEPIAIGRWQWVSPDPDQPATVTIWKNDIHRAIGDPVVIPPGESVEASPEFPL